MTEINNWSKEEIKSVFDVLGLGQQDYPSKYVSFDGSAIKSSPKNVILPKLSDSSVPLPSGSITNANMEKSSR